LFNRNVLEISPKARSENIFLPAMGNGSRNCNVTLSLIGLVHLCNHNLGIILTMGTANQGRCYLETPPLIGCTSVLCTELSLGVVSCAL